MARHRGGPSRETSDIRIRDLNIVIVMIVMMMMVVAITMPTMAMAMKTTMSRPQHAVLLDWPVKKLSGAARR